mmetsp:Transcript_19242/g.53246  ORF Transcript_19242/g.53246 Transcript_19242/m.53246 type:complete len:118 (+) Transcript_19242:6-359(+)
MKGCMKWVLAMSKTGNGEWSCSACARAGGGWQNNRPEACFMLGRIIQNVAVRPGSIPGAGSNFHSTGRSRTTNRSWYRCSPSFPALSKKFTRMPSLRVHEVDSEKTLIGGWTGLPKN